MKNTKAKIKISEIEIENRLKKQGLSIERQNKENYGSFIGFIQKVLANEKGIILSQSKIGEILRVYKVGTKTYLEIVVKQLTNFSEKDLYTIIETIKNNTKVYATERYGDIVKTIYLDFDLIKKEDFKRE